MFDYKLLAALAAVVERGSFERAAQALGLSQSAVSQRIKLLEARVGQAVLVRGTPPQPTEFGRRLLNHVRQVRQLESDLRGAVPALDQESQPRRLRIALNADSLATWWAPAVEDFCREHALLFDLVVEDQDVGLKRMRDGDVAACLCAAAEPVAGARSLALGRMRYRALATPDFVARWFADGVNAPALRRAPVIVFGPDDRLQHRYLEALGVRGDFPHHLCPSSEGFVRMVAAGLGFGMLPELQVQRELAAGELRELIPGRSVDVPLYWHHWRQGGAVLSALTAHLARVAGRWLRTDATD